MLRHSKELKAEALSRQGNLCLNNKSCRLIELCHDKIKLSRDRNQKRTEISQDKYVTTKFSMSQQTAQPATKTREEKSVATKRKLYRNRNC